MGPLLTAIKWKHHELTGAIGLASLRLCTSVCRVEMARRRPTPPLLTPSAVQPKLGDDTTQRSTTQRSTIHPPQGEGCRLCASVRLDNAASLCKGLNGVGFHRLEGYGQYAEDNAM